MRERDYKETEDMILFLNSIYCQWYICEFKDYEGTRFSSAEQFMMYHKFKCLEPENAYKVLDTHNPRLVKLMGRQIKNYNEEKWSKCREQVVALGNYYKFSQNPELLDIMLEHKYKEIVEASPEDPIWGIGLFKEDPRCLDKTQWLGLNLLGNCIMLVRNMILNKEPIGLLEKEVYYK